MIKHKKVYLVQKLQSITAGCEERRKNSMETCLLSPFFVYITNFHIHIQFVYMLLQLYYVWMAVIDINIQSNILRLEWIFSARFGMHIQSNFLRLEWIFSAIFWMNIQSNILGLEWIFTIFTYFRTWMDIHSNILDEYSQRYLGT